RIYLSITIARSNSYWGSMLRAGRTFWTCFGVVVSCSVAVHCSPPCGNSDLSPTDAVVVSVVDATSGAPVPFATVTASAGNGESTLCAYDGWACPSITIGAGNNTLLVSAPGYLSNQSTVVGPALSCSDPSNLVDATVRLT